MADTTDTSSSVNDNSNKELVNISELNKEIILTKINNIRSNLQLLDYQDRTFDYNNIVLPIKESYCHAFYRMLGLPVINSGINKFYNPGFFGNEEEINFEERDNIDKNQSYILSSYEDLRETICYENNLAFEKPDPNFTYKLDLLQERMTIDILDDSNDMFFESSTDQQSQYLSKRKLYNLARKILRPFKCSAKIANNIFPITNSICAPFVSEDNSTVNSTKLSKSYLEFVLSTRMSKDIKANTSNNALYTSLQAQIQDLNLSGEVQETINIFSDLENYIVGQMFQSLFYICKKVGEETKNMVKIVEAINSKININNGTNKETVAFDSIDSAITKKNAEIAKKELILTIIPNYTVKDSTGNDIAFQNYIECPLISPFIKLVQPNLTDLKSQVDQLNSEKKKRLDLFNSLNKSIFYTMGEVNGLGLIDIIAIMLAFWLIPKNHILSMLDKPSFIRMHRNVELHNEDVVQRHETYQDEPVIEIKNVMINFDQTIVEILKSCEQIIKNNSV